MKILGTNHLVLAKIVIKKVFDSGNFYNWNSLGERERNKTEFKNNQTLFAKTNLEQSKTNCNFRRDFLIMKMSKNIPQQQIILYSLQPLTDRLGFTHYCN